MRTSLLDEFIIGAEGGGACEAANRGRQKIMPLA
jgi:hypothetical protein